MKAISQFVVHFFDLIEAEGGALLTVVRTEGRRVRTGVTNLALGAAFLLLSVPLFTGGFWLVAAGVLSGLEPLVGRPLATALTGCMLLACGAACIGCFHLLARRRQP